eukprot:4110333-Heterocapsa_arctica.AAC.1
MTSDNVLNKFDFKDTGVQVLLPNATFSGKEPEGKMKVKRDNLPSKTESQSEFKETCFYEKEQMN